MKRLVKRNRFLPGLAVALMLMLCSFTQVSAAASRWLHVQVEEKGETNISLRIPVKALTVFLAMMPEQARVQIKHKQEKIPVAQLREAWKQLKASGDGQFLKIEDNGDSVSFLMEAGYLVGHVHSKDNERVSLRIPARVIDALLKGTGEELNLEAAVQELEQAGELEVEVVEPSSRVHIFISEEGS